MLSTPDTLCFLCSLSMRLALTTFAGFEEFQCLDSHGRTGMTDTRIERKQPWQLQLLCTSSDWMKTRPSLVEGCAAGRREGVGGGLCGGVPAQPGARQPAVAALPGAGHPLAGRQSLPSARAPDAGLDRAHPLPAAAGSRDRPAPAVHSPGGHEQCAPFHHSSVLV